MTAARTIAWAADRAGVDLPVRIRAWDGSEAGPRGGPVVVLHSPRALRRVLWQPGELGLARAYVSGDLEIEGDLTEVLRRSLAAASAGESRVIRTEWADLALAFGLAAKRLGVFGPPPAPPACELRHRGRPNSRARARSVVAGHYEIPASFYELVLDPSMAYSCAYWTSDDPGYGVADAQRDKLDLICRKLGLGPGSRLLDLGCGWGSLTVHAAAQYKARVTAVTLADEQGRTVRARLADQGLSDQAEVRVHDYRDADGGPYDAITSIEMGEHVGAAGYPAFCAQLRDLLRPGGRVLVQQMSSRGTTLGMSIAPGGGPFIESYIAADMHMRPVGETIGLLEAAGLEVTGMESLRPHYVRTIRAWLENFERNAAAAEAIIGTERMRVWRMYLTVTALAFEQGRVGVDQIVAVRPA